MNIKELLAKQSLHFAHKPAIIFSGQSLNFRQLRNSSFAVANYLLKAGVHNGDRIAVFSPNTPPALVSFLGILSMGATLVPLDFMLSQEEIIFFVNHSQAKVLFARYRKGINLSRIREKCPCLKKFVVWGKRIDSFACWDDMLKEFDQSEPVSIVNDNSLAMILYTSGSTGRPKGVELTFRHLDDPVSCINYFLDVSCRDIMLCGGVPFSHIGGMDYIIMMLYFGQTLVLMERFHPLEFIRNISLNRISWFWIVPSMYVALLSLKEYDKFDLSSLRYVVVFGAPSSAVLLRRFHKMCPCAYLLNGWGMTETAAPNCVLPPGVEKIESIGKFMPGMEVKVVDIDGESLGPGEAGELWVKGKAVMRGYYRQPVLTREILTSDGWLKTGDIAVFDEQGLFYIVGRIKDMIKVGGEVVFSTEVEEAIRRHPGVAEAAVIGVEDKLRGQVPKAFIVIKENETLSSADLQRFLRIRLAHFKIPHYFEFLKELPRTRIGKVDKKELR